MYLFITLFYQKTPVLGLHVVKPGRDKKYPACVDGVFTNNTDITQ